METTKTFLKQNGLTAAALSVLIYLQFDTGGEVRDLRNDMAEGHQAIRAEMAEEFRAVRAEMAEGHQEIRAEMVKGDQALRADMNAGFQSIRAEIAEGDQSIRAEVSALGERIAQVETRLTGVERVLYADIEPPAL